MKASNKTITPDEIALLSQKIIEEREKLSDITGEAFNGVSVETLLSELSKKLDPKDSAIVVHFKLSKDDINAAMNNRFFKATGQKLLMGAIIIILALLMMVKYIPAFPAIIYYLAVIVVGGGLAVLYSKKQRAFKRALAKGSAVKNLHLGEE
jgi:hypothetical protein